MRCSTGDEIRIKLSLFSSKSMENVCLNLCMRYIEEKLFPRSALQNTAASHVPPQTGNLNALAGGRRDGLYRLGPD